MSKNGKLVDAVDVPIVKLVPRNERSVSKKYKTRIEASLKAVGLIDPLIVFPLGDDYEILEVPPVSDSPGTWGRSRALPDRQGTRGLHRQPDGQPAQPSPGNADAAKIPGNAR